MTVQLAHTPSSICLVLPPTVPHLSLSRTLFLSFRLSSDKTRVRRLGREGFKRSQTDRLAHIELSGTPSQIVSI